MGRPEVAGRTVAGAFSTLKAENAMRAADTPPTCPALDRRRERLLASILTAPKDAEKRALLSKCPEDDSRRRRVSKWSRGASADGNLVREGQQVEEVKPRPPRGSRDPIATQCAMPGQTGPSVYPPDPGGWSLLFNQDVRER